MFNGQLPAHVKLSFSKQGVVDDVAIRKKKRKRKAGEKDDPFDKQRDAVHKNRLATLDIFAGCGGLSHGLQQAGNFQSKLNLMSIKKCSMTNSYTSPAHLQACH